jgi:hypothetical protein
MADGVACNVLGYALLGEGDLETARRVLEEALPVERKIGDTWLVAWPLDGLARIAVVEGASGRTWTM